MCRLTLNPSRGELSIVHKSRLSTVTALAVFGVLMALLFGSVTTAKASSTSSRDQAVRVAKSYLEFQGFSLKGLVHQLKFEGFSTSDATYGATHAGANWTKQAVRVAKSYLESQGFSFTGLVHQLEFDGFTPAQAVHGVHGAGL
jgi:hypothetical protein